MPVLISHTQNPRPSAPQVERHNTARNFLAATYHVLRHYERSANIILAHALKRVSTEDILTSFQFTTERNSSTSSTSINGSSFWLTVWTPHSSSPRTLDLILSSTTGTLGNHPIFLWTPNPSSVTASAWLVPRISALVSSLLTCIPPKRVFSVFGMTALVRAFASCWTHTTGFETEKDPFYAALFTYCTRQTLLEYRQPSYRLPTGHRIGRASPNDLEAIARLCKAFADDSYYFPLTIERARLEARELISGELVWVYAVGAEITAICAVTRSSLKISAITKVFTHPQWRGNRFAEHLVRQVTKTLLDCGKEEVVLYVSHDNSARRVYDRVGYVGLGEDTNYEGVEDSLELGFVGADRGHW